MHTLCATMRFGVRIFGRIEGFNDGDRGSMALILMGHALRLPTSYVEKPPFPVRMKDHAKASIVVRKSNIRTYTP